MKSQIEIQLLKSPIGTTPSQRETLRGLGFAHREQIVIRPDSQTLRGMLRAVLHLVHVRPISDTKSEKRLSPLSIEIIPPSEPPKVKVPKKVASPAAKNPKKVTAKAPTARSASKERKKAS